MLYKYAYYICYMPQKVQNRIDSFMQYHTLKSVAMFQPVRFKEHGR